MKFKAVLSDHGCHLLERRFLPAFERVGRSCHVYLTPSDCFLMHNALTTDGVQAICQFPKDVLFTEYRVSSQNQNRIAFSIEIALFIRALRSSEETAGDRLLMKLVKKSPSPTERSLPYLSLESKGHHCALVQDVPISQPLNRADVDELQAAIDLVRDLPEVFVQLPDLQQLQPLIDRLRNVDDHLQVAVTKAGSLCLRAVTPRMAIAADLSHLPVWRATAAAAAAPPSSLSAAAAASEPSLSSRLEELRQRGEAACVTVNSKHFAKMMQVHCTKPDASYCGVAPFESCLLLMFQFSGTPISLQYRLPLLDQEQT